MAFDGIVLKKVTNELSSCLTGGKINKVFEPSNNEIVLGIYSGGKNYALLCNISSSSYRIHLTTTSKPNPLNAPNFCMLLRKHLIGYRIKSILTPGLERLVIIELEGYNELNDLQSKKLIIELMGKHSNIILLNDNDKIIDSLRHLDISSGSLRDIMPARTYEMPTSEKNDFYKTNRKQFIEKINGSIIESICNSFTGFSNCFVSSMLEDIGISDTDYTENDLNVVYDTISNILANLETTKISLYRTGKDYCIANKACEDSLQANFFLDDFYFQKEKNEGIIVYRNNLLKLVLTALKKVSKKISNINSKLKECENMDTFRIYGELITSNLYRIDDSIKKSSIVLNNYYDENKEIDIPLDNTITVSYNAKKYFKKYHKLKNTLEIVSSQKIDAENELNYLESIVYELESATSIDELDEIYQEISENGIFKPQEKSNAKKNKVNKRKAHDEFEPITFTVDGFILYVGKNNKQNDYITTKLGKNEDLWFHTKDIRGSHCLLKCNGSSNVEEHTILTCAQIAAFYSKAKLSSNVPVDYCFVKHVKKPNGAKPGMVIYTDQRTAFVEPKIPN